LCSRDGVRGGHTQGVSRLVIPQRGAPLLECRRVACVRSHAAAAGGFSVLAIAGSGQRQSAGSTILPEFAGRGLRSPN
jgi:homoaconitase/3-isopropylmalate dehydratase large subunit